MKYIMMETEEGQKVPLIFPEFMVHSHMAKLMELALDKIHQQKSRVVSAGFINISEVECHGSSESLEGLSPGPMDSAYIHLGDAAAYMPEPMVNLLYKKMKGEIA